MSATGSTALKPQCHKLAGSPTMNISKTDAEIPGLLMAVAILDADSPWIDNLQKGRWCKNTPWNKIPRS